MTAGTPCTLVVPLLCHAGSTDCCGTFIPEDDSPPVLIIGARASADKVQAQASRHSLDVAMLLAFSRSGLPGAG